MNDALTNATIALVIVTSVLALAAVGALIANVYQARQTTRAVTAAVTEAKAVQRQAAASEQLARATAEQSAASQRQAAASERLAGEAQRNRELDWQPLLRFEDVEERHMAAGGFAVAQPTIHPTVFNDGRGPAYRTVRVGRNDAALTVSTPPVAIGPVPPGNCPPARRSRSHLAASSSLALSGQSFARTSSATDIASSMKVRDQTWSGPTRSHRR